MLLKATKIHEAIGIELERRSRPLEVDGDLKKIIFEVLFNNRTGLPARVRCEVHSESDLTQSAPLVALKR